MANGKYSFTLGAVGGTASAPFDPSAIPADTEYAGVYHTHGAFDVEYFNEQFSGPPNDITVALSPQNQGFPTHLGTPAGRIELFDPSRHATLPWGCVPVGSGVTPGPGISTVPVPVCP